MARPTIVDRSIGAHITFEAADVELQVAAYKVAPTLIVQHWALFGLRQDVPPDVDWPADRRVQIKAVRIIGTCAICGCRTSVNPCTECERDVCAREILGRGGSPVCLECA